MKGKSRRTNESRLPEPKVADTVAVVMRIVHDRQPLSAAVSGRVAWLVREFMRMENKHDTALRVAQAKFATWADGARQELRRLSPAQDD